MTISNRNYVGISLEEFIKLFNLKPEQYDGISVIYSTDEGHFDYGWIFGIFRDKNNQIFIIDDWNYDGFHNKPSWTQYKLFPEIAIASKGWNPVYVSENKALEIIFEIEGIIPQTKSSLTLNHVEKI